MEKPYYIGLEDGLRAIPGIPFESVENWRELKNIVKQFTNPKTEKQVKEMYQTIIFDGVYDSAIMCQQYICSRYGAIHMGETSAPGENRPNLWTAYEVEYLTEIGKLLKSGFTVVFIGHEEENRDTGKKFPRGDKRSMILIRNKADLTVHLEYAGTDEHDKELNSTAWFVETDRFFARSRFPHIIPKIEFTAENLEKALSDAIKKEEETSGHKAVSYKEQSEDYHSEELNYDKLMKEVKDIGAKLQGLEKIDEIYKISEKHIGKGGFVLGCEKGQEQVIAVILDEMKELLEDCQ